MSLDFSVENMKNYNVLTTIIYPGKGMEGGRKWHPVTNALIWGTMAIGMGSITADNWQEFYNRLNMWERCVGSQLWRGQLPQNDPRNWITPLEVYMHIGLHTNASRKTEAQFLKDCMETLRRDNKVEFQEAPNVYEALALDTITEDEWQRAWRFETSPEDGKYDTESNVFRIREKETTDEETPA